MKNALILIILFSTHAYAQWVDGAMDCTVTGNVVVASEEGKFKTYNGIQGGVTANEKLTLNYTVFNNSISIVLKRKQAEQNIVIIGRLSSKDIGTSAEKYENKGFGLQRSSYGHTKSIQFSSDYIEIKNFGEFSIRRYYKNDWHGIYSFINLGESTIQTLTLNCRHTDDKMEDAFQIFTGYTAQK